jgi:peptidoglycan/LPS O-acetylase OafA/YrhL
MTEDPLKRGNNFNLLRWVAAVLVILSHAYGLRHPAGFYPRAALLSSQGLGWAAVNVFFVMSGYLIAGAAQRDPDPLRFLRNRALRIYPGLIVCTAMSVLTLGLVFHPDDMPRFLGSGETLTFLLGNASAVAPHYTLPGVFAANPYAGVVNGSLWSLPFEVVCYGAAALLLAGGVLTRRRLRALTFGLAIGGHVAGLAAMMLGRFPSSTTLHEMHRLGICFVLGMAFAYTDTARQVRLWQVLAAVGVFALSTLTTVPALHAAAATAALILTIFWLGFLRRPWLTRLRGLPDWSYGVYIYAFPIQQGLIAAWPDLPPLLHAAIAFGLTLIPAALSWRLIQRPALALKRQWDGRTAPVSTAGADEPQGRAPHPAPQ